MKSSSARHAAVCFSTTLGFSLLVWAIVIVGEWHFFPFVRRDNPSLAFAGITAILNLAAFLCLVSLSVCLVLLLFRRIRRTVVVLATVPAAYLAALCAALPIVTKTDPEHLVVYLRRLEAGMTADQLSQVIPQKYLDSERSAEGLNWLVDRAFKTNGAPATAVSYVYDKGLDYASAMLYFDGSGEILGFNYGGSSAPPLETPVTSRCIRLGVAEKESTQQAELTVPVKAAPDASSTVR